jgi:hypothetical protein
MMQAGNLAAFGLPAAAGLAEEQRAVGEEERTHHARREAGGEVDGEALFVVADFFRAHAHEVGLGLVADEHLAGEGAELVARGVPRWIARRIGETPLREEHGGHLARVGDFLPRNLGRVRRHAGAIDESGRMTVERALLQDEELRSAHELAAGLRRPSA